MSATEPTRREAPQKPSSQRSEEAELLQEPKLDRALLWRLLVFAKPYRNSLIFAILLLLVLSAAELLFPILTMRAIDDYVRPGNLPGLIRISLLYLGLLAAVFVLRYGQGVLTQRIGQSIMHDLRTRLFAHLQRLDISYFDRNPTGRIMTRLTGDVETLNELFTSGLVSIFGDLLTLIGITAVLFVLDWRLALVTLTVVPVLFGITMIFRAKVRYAYGLTRIRIAAINAFLQENVTGVALVHLFDRQARQRSQFDARNASHRDAFLLSVRAYSLYFPGVEFLEVLAVALILWYGGGEVVQQALTLGSLVAFIQYSERFFRPIRDLSERYNILQGAMVASERIFELLDREPRIVSPRELGANASGAADAPIVADAPAIEFHDVRFSYVPDEEVLRGVSFSVQRGESVAVVGHTGAGKSTLVGLALRFHDVSSGAVLIDGRDVRAWPLDPLRRRIGLVAQDVFLWGGGIRLNVGLRAGQPEERVRAAIAAVGAEAIVEQMGGDLDADLGERGQRLSVGQRQLLAFARVLAFDPPILVLDEATSSVDTETEQHIQRALATLLQGRTSLVIAHRLSTIRHADRILVMHRGKLVEEGSHDELLAKGGIYAKYFELEYV